MSNFMESSRCRSSASLWMSFQVNLGIIGWTPPPITADEIVKKEDIKVEEDGDDAVVTAKGPRKIQGKKREGRTFCPTDLRREEYLLKNGLNSSTVASMLNCMLVVSPKSFYAKFKTHPLCSGQPVPLIFSKQSIDPRCFTAWKKAWPGAGLAWRRG